jgi:hypothetical protein
MNLGANTIILGFLIFVQECNAAPVKGSQLPPRNDGVEVLNEPCYVHDGACDGYPVCCVTAGTCISKHSGTISSTTAYYEGGCQSHQSSKKDWSEKHKNAGCVQQGECMIQHIGACKGGFTKPGYLTEVPKEVLDRFMGDSCESDCAEENYGHRSRDATGTTTTTTTVLTRHTGTLSLAISDTSAVDVDKLTHMVKRTLGIMSGYGASHSAITVEAPALSSTMTFTYHVDVSSSHQVMGKPITVDDVKANIEGMEDSRINEVLAMMIGSCSYTAVVTDPPPADTIPSTPSTAHGAASTFVAMMATVSVAVLVDYPFMV